MAFRDIMRGGMGDAITDEKVKQALNANIKEAVADALRDPEFTLIARETVKDALRDRDVHRAALEGAMGNLSVKLNPFRRSNDDAASPRGRADSESGARSPPPPAQAFFVDKMYLCTKCAAHSRGYRLRRFVGTGRAEPARGAVRSPFRRATSANRRRGVWGRLPPVTTRALELRRCLNQRTMLSANSGFSGCH